jgi:hypothetical protein
MTDTGERFREGAEAFRNARKGQRDQVIAAANGRVIVTPAETSTLESSSYTISQSIDEPTVPESETSADELSFDVGIDATRTQGRRKRRCAKIRSKPGAKRRSKGFSPKNS